jgi:tetratricopeptide (TPR) repeat protein
MTMTMGWGAGLVGGLVLSGAATALVVAGLLAEPGPGEDLVRIEARVVELQSDLARARGDLELAVAGQQELDLSVSTLRHRLGRLEQQGAVSMIAAGPEPTAPEGASRDVAGAPEAGPDDEALAAEFAELLALGVLDDDGRATPDQQARFWELARTTGALGDLIAGLEARVQAAPGNTESRMELADAYVAKLLTVPGGPERGVWGARAEGQWRDILAVDPGHWGANFALAENYSYYPKFMGKTGEAIDGMEKAKDLQQALAPQPDHVQTYLILSRLYLDQGDVAAARTALQSGLAYHPGDAELLAALEALP